jgi:hypothetical protein
MRDYSKGRSGFDRVLMAVAATFLTVSAGAAAAAQSAAPRDSVSELAIDAAVPRPEPANVAPPTAADFKADAPKAETTASVPDATRTSEKTIGSTSTDTPKATEAAQAPADVKPSEAVTAPAAATPPAATAVAPPAPAAEPPKDVAKDIAKPATTVASSDQPVAEKLRDMFVAKSTRYFDRKNERADDREVLRCTRLRAGLDPGRQQLTAAAKGVIARLKDAASDGLNRRRLPAAGLRSRHDTRYARRCRAQAHRQHVRLCAPGSERPHALVAGQRRHPLSGASDRSERRCSPRSRRRRTPPRRSTAYNPPQKLYKELKAKLAELRGERATAR